MRISPWLWFSYVYRVISYDTDNDVTATPSADAAYLLPAPTNVTVEPVLNETGTFINSIKVSFDDMPLEDLELGYTYSIFRNGTHSAYIPYARSTLRERRRTVKDVGEINQGEDYTYQVRQNAGARAFLDTYHSAFSAPVVTTMPSPRPENLTASVAAGGVALEWTASPHTKLPVTGHRVYRTDTSADDAAVHIYDTGSAATRFVDEQAMVNSRYAYGMAEMVGDVQGYKSARVSTRTRNIAALTAPLNLASTIAGVGVSSMKLHRDLGITQKSA